MIKPIVKFLAKQWVDKHKNDSLVMNLTDKTITGYEIYTDFLMYIILYGLLMFIWIIGIPVGTLYLSGMSIGWTILSFFLCLITAFIFTIVVFVGIIKGIHKEIINLINKL